MDKAARLETIDPFHGAVVLEREPFRQRTNGRLRPSRQTTKRKQQQILLWFEPGLTGSRIAFTKKMTDAITPLRQRPVVGGSNRSGHNLSYRNTI